MAEKILIVDDDLETLRLVGLMLQRQGYQIITAANGTQAIQMATSEHPDVIILDVMMPDMDGYEVTRLLRQAPDTSATPIMMFTAKSMVDDKVAGYDSGVDDYITKPVHPAELVAHIKSILGRTRNRVKSNVERGQMVGFIAAKGGLGLSTLVLNLAVTLQKKNKSQVIAAELRPGLGTWGVELGYANSAGLKNLVQLKPPQINLAAIEKELINTSYGVRLLLASNHLQEAACGIDAAHLEAILQELPLLGSMILLDMGAMLVPGLEKAFDLCQELVVITEPFPATVHRTRMLLDDLREHSSNKSKQVSVVLYSHIRSDLQLPINQVQDMLAVPISAVFTPAPEAAYNATLRSVPLVTLQPDGSTSLQFGKLADLLLNHAGK
jgi:DNA-binding response OmpR family regulator